MGLILERIENNIDINTARFASDTLKASRHGYVLTVIIPSHILLHVCNPRDSWPVDKNKIQVLDDDNKIWEVIGSSLIQAGDIEKIIMKNIERVACQIK